MLRIFSTSMIIVWKTNAVILRSLNAEGETPAEMSGGNTGAQRQLGTSLSFLTAGQQGSITP